jgi:hypothetical protein
MRSARLRLTFLSSLGLLLLASASGCLSKGQSASSGSSTTPTPSAPSSGGSGGSGAGGTLAGDTGITGIELTAESDGSFLGEEVGCDAQQECEGEVVPGA